MVQRTMNCLGHVKFEAACEMSNETWPVGWWTHKSRREVYCPQGTGREVEPKKKRDLGQVPGNSSFSPFG